MTERAERTDTSCSPERPPKITPMRSFLVIGFLPLPLGEGWGEDLTRDYVLTLALSQREREHTLRYKILFPSADSINCTPNTAVRLLTSSAVLISTTSNDRMPPASEIFSSAKCASR